MSENLLDAESELAAFPLKPILVALKQHPDGVGPKFFNNGEHRGIDMNNPVAVGAAMKWSNAILYDIRTHQYKLKSWSCVTMMLIIFEFTNNTAAV